MYIYIKWDKVQWVLYTLMGKSTSGTQPKSQKIEANNQEGVQRTPLTRPLIFKNVKGIKQR
jgi:hypothetical protein